MNLFKSYWRKRTERAERALIEANTYIEQLEARTRLMDITRSGRINRFIFTRNGEMFIIETMGTWDDDVAGWKRDLL